MTSKVAIGEKVADVQWELRWGTRRECTQELESGATLTGKSAARLGGRAL